MLPEFFSPYPVFSHRIWSVLQEIAGTRVLVSYPCHALNNACCRGHSSSLPDPAGEHREALLPWKLSIAAVWSLVRACDDLKPTLPAAKPAVPGPQRTAPFPSTPQDVSISSTLTAAGSGMGAQCSLLSCSLLRLCLLRFLSNMIKSPLTLQWLLYMPQPPGTSR